MIAEFSLLNASVTVAFGALAGGITNAVAIWMLFHPYEPRGIGRFKLQGAIPKNKTRLAKTIGRTVGKRLLTPEDLASHLSSPDIRGAFERAVNHLVVAVLETERRSLEEELPKPLMEELDSAFETLGPTLASRFAEFSQSEAFKEAVEDFLERLRNEMSDEPIGRVLTEARRTAIRDQVETWVAETVASQGMQNAIDDWLERQISRLSEDRTPLIERLPVGLIAAVEQAIANYIPMALDRLTQVLRDPISRNRIQRALHGLSERFTRDLLLHERIVAKLVVTERNITRLLDNFERDGAETISRLAEEPEMRTQVARGINDAVVNFLRRSMAEHIATLGPERVAGIRETLQTQITAALSDSATRTYAIDRLDRALEGFEERTWGEILVHLPPDQAAEWIARNAGSPRVKAWIEEGTQSALQSLIQRPIGKPADWLDEGAIQRITAGLTPVLWEWVQDQVPKIVSQIDIATMVEEKVLGFSLQRIEEIVRNTTQRELDIIIRLGYVLGAVVGASAYAVSLLLP